MLFNSSIFTVFLAIVLFGHWALVSRRSRNLFLLGASYAFYGWWDWRFLALLIGTSTIDFFVGVGIHDSQNDRTRKALVWLSCCTNLATLIFFKYFNFFSENLRVALESAGVHPSWPVLNIILPVGVSFYTLQAMTYTIDIYRRVIPPCRDYPDFLLFVSYFPQLVAGPISKARHLLPQIRAERRFDPALAAQAIPYIAIGYVLKTVVADNMADIVTTTLANVRAHSGLELAIVAYCNAYEMYGDFAGYTYIALGVSMLFGIQLPQNFRMPFLSQSVKEYWSRWHISLTSWLREYLYFSLGGSRLGVWRQRLNIMIVFVLSGLWHGARWPCVVWGFINGFEYFIPAPFSSKRRVGAVLNTFVMLNLLVASIIFFRVVHLNDAFLTLERVATDFWPTAGEPGIAEIWHLYWWRVLLIVGVIGFEIVQRHAQDLPQIAWWRPWVRYAFYGALAMLYFYRGNFSRIPFVYFQF
ncbi:MAG: MBOAT family O-acyltransferase [Gemmatimonadaceae bacterium]